MNLRNLLHNPVVWELSRIGLNWTFGVYRHRFARMQQWRVLEPNPTVLDIGCGIGQYAQITNGTYLGVDLNERYIAYASKRHRKPHQSFRCQDVAEVLHEQSRFDMVLMVDFLHHIPDEQCLKLLVVAGQLTRRYVVSFEPITFQPHPVGRWMVEHDRGKHVRPLDSLHALFRKSGLHIADSVALRLGPINTRAILACAPGESAAS